jgi:hypothetical protein
MGQNMTEDQKELREERTAIMEVEGATPEEIQKVFTKYPWIFGADERNAVQDSLL